MSESGDHLVRRIITARAGRVRLISRFGTGCGFARVALQSVRLIGGDHRLRRYDVSADRTMRALGQSRFAAIRFDARIDDDRVRGEEHLHRTAQASVIMSVLVLEKGT